VKGLSPLNIKLLRDIWHMRGQAIAVGIIVACGVAIMVMALGTLSTLSASRDAYYERYRFADVFASVRRAPESAASRLREIDGVQTVETRIVRLVILRIENVDEPANAQIVSIPDDSDSILNKIVLFHGRFPEARSPDEIIISNAFAEANELQPGDAIEAVMNGRLRTLTIVGIGDSPEFIYALGPGTLLPDDRLFGIFWMRRRALEAAFDLDGAFNNVSLTVAPGTDTTTMIDQVDDVLAPYRRNRSVRPPGSIVECIRGLRNEPIENHGADHSCRLPDRVSGPDTFHTEPVDPDGTPADRPDQSIRVFAK
jgi:putative ABC transport system permease protein